MREFTSAWLTDLGWLQHRAIPRDARVPLAYSGGTGSSALLELISELLASDPNGSIRFSVAAVVHVVDQHGPSPSVPGLDRAAEPATSAIFPAVPRGCVEATDKSLSDGVDGSGDSARCVQLPAAGKRAEPLRYARVELADLFDGDDRYIDAAARAAALDQLLGQPQSTAARRELVQLLMRRSLANAALKLGCSEVLFGSSRDRLALDTLAGVVSGRGAAIAAVGAYAETPVSHHSI